MATTGSGEQPGTRTIVRVEQVTEKACPAPNCGKIFVGLSRQRFCSVACRNRANYHANREDRVAARRAKYREKKAAKAKEKRQASA